MLHHVELWVPSLERATRSWGWLLSTLGWEQHQDWPAGRSWREPGGGAYLVVEQSPALTGERHVRTAPGLNHLALWAPSRVVVDRVAAEGPAHGWGLLFVDRHPWAGGPRHYAAYLEDVDGYEAEVVARD